MCVRRKSPLKTPLGPFKKKGGGFKTPHAMGFLRTPPPPCVTRAFSGIPNTKRREQHHKWSPTKGNKIKSGRDTPAFSGAQRRAQMLCHPCILRDPQRQARGATSKIVPNIGEQNQKWLPHPCLLWGPKEGANAMSPLHSQGSPTPNAGSNIKNCPQHRGTKLEVAALLLPSRGPKRGRKCYVTPTF